MQKQWVQNEDDLVFIGKVLATRLPNHVTYAVQFFLADIVFTSPRSLFIMKLIYYEKY